MSAKKKTRKFHFTYWTSLLSNQNVLNPVMLFTAAQRTCQFLFAKIRDGAKAAQKGSVSVTSVLGGDHAATHTQLTWAIVSVTMIMNVFAKYLEDLETVEGRELSSDQQMNSGSQGVEKSEVVVYHTRPVAHTHSTYTWILMVQYFETPLPTTSSSAVACPLNCTT